MYKMEIRPDKTKITINNPNDFQRDEDTRPDTNSSRELQVPRINHL